MASDDDFCVLVRRLVRYLCDHPHAADTPEAIGRWWLGDAMTIRRATLREALDWLEQHRLVERLSAADGHVRYRRTDRDADFARRVEALLAARGSRY